MYCPSRARQALRAEQAAIMNCMVAHTCRAFTACPCSALSSAVRGINAPADGERLSRFGRLQFEHHRCDRTVVLNEERELPDVSRDISWDFAARSALT